MSKQAKIEQIRKALQPAMEHGGALCLRQLKKGEEVRPDDLFRLQCTSESNGKEVKFKDIPEGFIPITILKTENNDDDKGTENHI
jgi:hypothetical protein